MLKLAVAVRCGWIFKEAATHVLGRSNRYFNGVGVQQQLEALGLSDLFRAKRKDFVSVLRKHENEMFRNELPLPPTADVWLSVLAVR